MRIGPEYQAAIPVLTSNQGDKGVGSVMVWMPTGQLMNEDIDAYLVVSKDKFGYGTEQALGMLYWHGYCIDKALENMPNFCPLSDEWSMEDKVIFQQAFQYHGKNFQRIRSMLPDKPISSLVKYYYLWKRSYSQYSLMDKQARKNWRRMGAGLPITNDETDSNKSGSSRSDAMYHHASSASALLYQAPPIFGKGGKQLPKGIHLTRTELMDTINDTDNAQIRRLDREILLLKKQLQDNKQILSVQREEEEEGGGAEMLRPTDYSRKSGSTTPTKWSDQELEIAIDIIKKHGKDCEALMLALEGKTLSQCRNFFTNYKRKLNLPSLIAEYEIRNGYKLSRYGRQAKELVENGGEGLQQLIDSAHKYPTEESGPGEPKRPRYNHPAHPHQGRGIRYNSPQVAITIA